MSWDEVPWEEIPSSEAVHGLPRSYWGYHLRTFSWEGLVSAGPREAAVRRFMAEHASGAAPHLVLLGKPGTGKTLLAVGLVRWEWWRQDMSAAVWIHVPSFFDEVKGSFEDGSDPWGRVERAGLVVLDDLLGKVPTDWEAQQVIPRLIGAPYRNGASIVITDNHPMEHLSATVDEHEVSRMKENSILIHSFDDPDRRLR